MSKVLLLPYFPKEEAERSAEHQSDAGPRKSIPGQNPVGLVRAKAIRNQIMMLREESEAIHLQAITILQRKWFLDDKIKRLRLEQDNLTRAYFEDNGLIKRYKPRKSREDSMSSMLEDLGMDVSEAIEILKKGIDQS